MKRVFAFLLTISVMLCFCGCSMEYGDERDEIGGITYYKSSMRKQCFAGAYKWDGNEENTTIDILDECDGYKVVELGGYMGRGVPVRFYIDIPETKTVADSVSEDAVVKKVHFTLNIGENIKELENVHAKTYSGDVDANEWIQPVFTVNCDEDNKYFYSMDGRLYSRKDNLLVEEFFYFDDLDDL